MAWKWRKVSELPRWSWTNEWNSLYTKRRASERAGGRAQKREIERVRDLGQMSRETKGKTCRRNEAERKEKKIYSSKGRDTAKFRLFAGGARTDTHVTRIVIRRTGKALSRALWGREAALIFVDFDSSFPFQTSVPSSPSSSKAASRASPPPLAVDEATERRLLGLGGGLGATLSGDVSAVSRSMEPFRYSLTASLATESRRPWPLLIGVATLLTRRAPVDAAGLGATIGGILRRTPLAALATLETLARLPGVRKSAIGDRISGVSVCVDVRPLWPTPPLGVDVVSGDAAPQSSPPPPPIPSTLRPGEWNWCWWMLFNIIHKKWCNN